MSRKNKKLRSVEDRHDLAIIEQRKNEKVVTPREMLKRLLKDGFIPTIGINSFKS